MDFVKLMSTVQRDKGLSDADMAKLTGINEYTYYSLKKYRLYLSKVAYFSISCVLGLPIEKNSVIDEILLENKEIVGLPESNLMIAAECVNPEYLEKLEIELNRLKKVADTVDEKNKVISSQFIEIERLKKELESDWNDLNKKIQEAYSNGVREGAAKVEMMKSSINQSMMMALNEEYTDKIDKLEKALHRVEKQYIALYKAVEYYNKISMDGINLTPFEKPLGLLKEELGFEISDDMKIQILNCYHNMCMTVESIMQETGVSRKNIENIINDYKITQKKGKRNEFILEELK